MRNLYNVVEDQGTVSFTVYDLDMNAHRFTVSSEGYYNHINGIGYIQNNFSNLNAEEREIIITGMNPSMWDLTFNEEE
jgi:hypothetical protein